MAITDQIKEMFFDDAGKFKVLTAVGMVAGAVAGSLILPEVAAIGVIGGAVLGAMGGNAIAKKQAETAEQGAQPVAPPATTPAHSPSTAASPSVQVPPTPQDPRKQGRGY